MVLSNGTGTSDREHDGHKQVFVKNTLRRCNYSVLNLAMQIFIFLRIVVGSKNHCTGPAGACLN